VLRRAEITLQKEREWLTQRLKLVLAEQEREDLFALWHITQIKERKKALSLLLWDPSVRPHLLGRALGWAVCSCELFRSGCCHWSLLLLRTVVPCVCFAVFA
jgi:hypothetical protein